MNGFMQPSDQIGNYIIKHHLAEGGMSIVYLAQDKRDGREVVVKQLRDECTFNPELVGRFAQNAQIMLELHHPHLARVFDYIERDGKYFMVEEYLSGGSLADLIKRRSCSEEAALGWCRDALRGVDYA